MDENYRRVALTLRSLNPEDRDWMLSHFSSEVKERVDSDIAELEALGIPSGLDYLDQITKPQQEEPALSERKELIKGLVKEINCVPRHHAELVLTTEPTRVKTLLMSMQNWGWNATKRSPADWFSLSKPKQNVVGLTAPLPPSLEENLLKVFAQELRLKNHK